VEGNDAQTVNPIVSIIIPTFNSESTIKECLQSVRSQSYAYIEALVIDNYSGDKTVEIAEKFNAKVLLKKSERSAARNYGAFKAKGTFLLFVDSDQELTPRVVKECVTRCLTRGIDAVIIPEESIAKTFWAECRKMEKMLYSNVKLFEAPRFFRKDSFQKVGGYDEDLVFGEDSDLYLRIMKAELKICKIQAKILHNEGEYSIKKVVLQSHNYGKTLSALMKKNPLVLSKYWSVPAIWLRNIKTLTKNPLHLAGLIFMKTVAYEAYIISILVRVVQ